MPPSWSTRLLSGGSGNNTPSSERTPTGRRDKTLPRPPSSYFDGDAGRAQPSPPRPQTSGVRQHAHGRSVSHPLPKLFGRKKSAGNLNGFHDTDVPLDESLVPVLAEPEPTPTRIISGKRRPLEDDGKTTRRCMCCDSKVNVPKQLEKFRCMCCLTINDLKPVAEQKDEQKGKECDKRASTYPSNTLPGGIALPLSVERTKAIIDRCLTTYLESRHQQQDEPAISAPEPPRKLDSPAQTPPADEEEDELAIAGKEAVRAAQQLADPPLSSSPPDTPNSADFPVLAPSATIKDFSDIDLLSFAYGRTDTPPPEPRPTARGPGPPRPPSSSGPVTRKPLPVRPNRKPPPPPVNVANRPPSQRLMLNGHTTAAAGPAQRSPRPQLSPRPTQRESKDRERYDRVKSIFKPLEDYLVASFGDCSNLNSAFSTLRPAPMVRARSESSIVTPPPEPSTEFQSSPLDISSELDAKMLLLGDIGENGSWWAGKLDRGRSNSMFKRKKVREASKQKMVTSKSPNINWPELRSWYDLVHTAGEDWRSKLDDLTKERSADFSSVEEIEEDLQEAREHTVRALLKITENVLKRPSRPLREPEDLRFLLIVLSNPYFYPSRVSLKPHRTTSGSVDTVVRQGPDRRHTGLPPSSPKHQSPQKSPSREGNQHTGLLKRILGLLANSSDQCHRYLIGWYSRFDEDHFVRTVDLVASFITYRIARCSSRPQRKSNAGDSGLIPDLSGSAMNTSAQLHSAMGLGGSLKKRGNEDTDQDTEWAGDWQLKTAAKFMSLLFATNNIWQGRRRNEERIDSAIGIVKPQDKARRSGQLLHTSSFYNMLLDYHDIIADFKVWESAKREKFAFCQFPLFLSVGAKIKVLEYDARRQMEIKAREAYFDQVIRQRAIDGYFHLRVRRDCMVDDSLQQISQAVGAGGDELKKGLRVHFAGEEGIDAGGPRKEWFLMVAREVFDPNHGLFVYDDESNTCYFNPNTFETSDQYYLVGALLGLAIYNSTILDIALPPFAFRKLLASAPAASTNASNVANITGTKGQMTYTISDLAEYKPSLARGLQQLLDFEGNVQETYCRDFVAPVERYGTITNVPLMSNGENTPVTNINRHGFVEAYIRYIIDGSVSRQFEPFKRGFFTVCAGNALSLFRAEEIELLIRGSDEALDVSSLRAVAVYENWRHFQPPHHMLPNPSETVPVIEWFWDTFARASISRQRKLLTFITGSDRIPAVGATSLVLRVVAGGDGWGGGGREERERFPIARTCFNMLVLWRYDHREQLEEKLWRAVEESEGFGLK